MLHLYYINLCHSLYAGVFIVAICPQNFIRISATALEKTERIELKVGTIVGTIRRYSGNTIEQLKAEEIGHY